MAKKDQPKIFSSNQGVFNTLADEIRLVLRLLADPRVNPLLKLIPIGTVIYFFIPDMLIGPFDDALIFGLGLYIFIELCPPEVVAEHRQYLRNIVDGNIHKSNGDEIPLDEDEVIEGEFRDE